MKMNFRSLFSRLAECVKQIYKYINKRSWLKFIVKTILTKLIDLAIDLIM